MRGCHPPQFDQIQHRSVISENYFFRRHRNAAKSAPAPCSRLCAATASKAIGKRIPHSYLLVDSGVFRFDIFSAYRAELDSAAYGQSFRQRETREKFLQDAAEQSVIQTEITPGIRDRILTLSTCSGMGHETRWVVQARLNVVLCKEGSLQI